MQTRHSDALAPLIDIIGSRLSVSPLISRTRIKKNRHEEEINETTSEFLVVAPIFLPLLRDILDTGLAADFEMLPAPMGRDLMVAVGAKVSLSELSVMNNEKLKKASYLYHAGDKIHHIVQLVLVDVEVVELPGLGGKTDRFEAILDSLQ